ncbi:uncharacterized protein ACBR49_013360 isoform 2-T2 [Aulostomus maculatus]
MAKHIFISFSMIILFSSITKGRSESKHIFCEDVKVPGGFNFSYGHKDNTAYGIKVEQNKSMIGFYKDNKANYTQDQVLTMDEKCVVLKSCRNTTVVILRNVGGKENDTTIEFVAHEGSGTPGPEDPKDGIQSSTAKMVGISFAVVAVVAVFGILIYLVLCYRCWSRQTNNSGFCKFLLTSIRGICGSGGIENTRPAVEEVEMTGDALLNNPGDATSPNV